MPLWKITQSYPRNSTITTTKNKYYRQDKRDKYILNVIILCYPYGQKHSWQWNTWQWSVISPKLCHSGSWVRGSQKSGATENCEYYKNEHSTYRSNSELWQFTALNLHFLSEVYWFKSVPSSSFTSTFTNLILKIRKKEKLMYLL